MRSQLRIRFLRINERPRRRASCSLIEKRQS
jgi:hypothetical protein